MGTTTKHNDAGDGDEFKEVITMMCNCNFPGCTAPGTIKTALARRGGRNAYMCEYHAFNIASYSTDNNRRQGKTKVSKDTFGWEFETSFSDLTARGELIAAKFLPTADCTVDVEYKSPIYNGLNSISKTFTTFDKLIAGGHLRIGEGCGTHTHYGNRDYIDRETMDYIRRFYHSLFVPLCEAIRENSDKTAAFWGRDFEYYASPINRNSYATEHTNFINVQHNNTIEFRLVKYQNAEQMMRVARFIKAVGNCLVENFIKHFNDADFDTRRYSNATAYRKHKAEVTAQKIVKLYIKAISEI